MAFDFLGTFTLGQLLELENFLDEKLLELDNQTNHMMVEAKRVRNLKIKYETALKNLGAPVNSDNVLITKRLQKIEISKAKWINQEFENQLFNTVSLNTDNNSPNVLNDASKAIIMDQIKKPFIQEIKFQRERLEHKIRKCGDLIEQLEEQRMHKLIARNEIARLVKLIKEILAAENASKQLGDLIEE